MKKLVPGVLVLLAGVALTGCAGRAVVPLADLDPPPSSDVYYVTLTGGQELEFVTLASSPDTLRGTVRTVRQRMVGEGSSERLEVRNQYREMAVPVRDVQKVEINRRSGGSSVLFAAVGVVAIGAAYALLRNHDTGTTGGGGGGKGPPPLPQGTGIDITRLKR